MENFNEQQESPKLCSSCKKPLTANSIFYSNGLAVCNQICGDRLMYKEDTQRLKRRYLKDFYLDTDISKLPCPQEHAKALEWTLNPKGLILQGETRTGKSRTLTLLLKKIFEDNPKQLRESVEIFYAGDLRECLLKATQDKTHYRFMSTLKTCELLVIDDFGKENFTDSFEADIFNIINGRIENSLPTIMTTNEDSESLKYKFSDKGRAEPFLERLNETFKIIPFVKN